MKASAREIELLGERIKSAWRGSGLKQREIAERTSIEPSQVSKICNGKFKTINGHVMQICKFLGVPIDEVPPEDELVDPVWLKIEESVRQLWDKTPEGAEKIANLLESVERLQS